MRRILRTLAILAILGGGALYWMYPRLSASRVQNPFDAAIQLEAAVREGKDTVTFRAEDVDLNEVYSALESIYPYAFSVHSTTRSNGTAELRVEVSRPARQRQAWEYAQQIAAEQIRSGMDDVEKLRALHDALIRLCVYDSQTAEGDRQDGATAPFAADGALLDHKAVCAGYGRAYVMLCEAAGLDAIYIASEKMDHGWNAVRLNGHTFYIDCTFDDPVPDRGEYVEDQYFMKSAEELWKTHVWDENFYEKVLNKIS